VLYAHAQRIDSLLAVDKDLVSCRVKGWGTYAMPGEVRAGRREGVRRWRGASGMHGGRPDSRLLEARARAERT
jgi:hypothetical protein